MRSKMVREGSVGLFIIFGVAVFVGLTVWLQGLEIKKNAYSFQIKFANANGMKKGAAVRYRGFEVGKIIEVNPGPNGVDVKVEITAANLKIPKDALIEANQAGLIGETSIDIMPRNELPTEANNLDPATENCNSDVIVCAEDKLVGQVGVSFDLLLRSTSKLTELYTDPVFFANLNNTAKNAGLAAGEIATLSKELTLLSKGVRQEIKTFSNAANAVTEAAEKSSNQLTITAQKIDNTVEEFGTTAQKIGTTVDKFGNTADEIAVLTNSLNGLVSENRANLQLTLNNISNTSKNLSETTKKLDNLIVNSNQTVTKVNKSLDQINLTETVKNLEVLTANAAEASNNIKDITKNINDPQNIVLLQQTLDAARVTFQNTQKITSDLDELTGDPQFRMNLLNLVNGLSNLVSTTENLETQIETAQILETLMAEKQTVKNTDKK